jgi:polar amino acid transport system permease protein
MGPLAFLEVVANELYAQVLRTLVKGIGITVFVAVVAYAGLRDGALGWRWRGCRAGWLRQIARLYIEVMRGVPIHRAAAVRRLCAWPPRWWRRGTGWSPLGISRGGPATFP